MLITVFTSRVSYEQAALHAKVRIDMSGTVQLYRRFSVPLLYPMLLSRS